MLCQLGLVASISYLLTVEGRCCVFVDFFIKRMQIDSMLIYAN